MRKIIVLLSAVFFTAATLMATTTPAQALPTCTKTVDWVDGTGHYRVPLPASGGGSWDCIMGVGAQSNAVQTLQLAIRECNGHNIAADSIYGPRTRDAVREIQDRGDVAVDGVYGPQTQTVTRWIMYYRNPHQQPPRCVTFDA